jgi:ribonucleotide monophosphatase NagD (HAD superfamily)
VNKLRNGAALIVTNPDLTHPEGAGPIAPETGTLLAALMIGSARLCHAAGGELEQVQFLLERLSVKTTE